METQKYKNSLDESGTPLDIITQEPIDECDMFVVENYAFDFKSLFRYFTEQNLHNHDVVNLFTNKPFDAATLERIANRAKKDRCLFILNNNQWTNKHDANHVWGNPYSTVRELIISCVRCYLNMKCRFNDLCDDLTLYNCSKLCENVDFRYNNKSLMTETTTPIYELMEEDCIIQAVDCQNPSELLTLYDSWYNLLESEHLPSDHYLEKIKTILFQSKERNRDQPLDLEELNITPEYLYKYITCNCASCRTLLQGIPPPNGEDINPYDNINLELNEFDLIPAGFEEDNLDPEDGLLVDLMANLYLRVFQREPAPAPAPAPDPEIELENMRAARLARFNQEKD